MGMNTTRTTNANSILAKTVYTHPNTLKDFHEALAYHLKHTWVEEEVLADLEMIYSFKSFFEKCIGSTNYEFRSEKIYTNPKGAATTGNGAKRSSCINPCIRLITFLREFQSFFSEKSRIILRFAPAEIVSVEKSTLSVEDFAPGP